jgi:hypothetical protein
MKKKLLSQRILSGLALMLLCSNVSFGQIVPQQIIGEFPVMDGGFEGQLIGPVTPNVVNAEKWTSTNTGPTGSALKHIDATAGKARTGNQFAIFTPHLTQNARFTSPTSTAFIADKYTIQYYAKSTLDPTSILGGALYTGVSTINVGAAVGAGATWVTDQWFKISVTLTATAAPTYAAVRFTANNTTLGLGDLSVDDFVVYAGDADVTAPDTPSAPIVSGLNVSWIAPLTGVDGGGYVVVRYATSPNADNDPKQNGLYGKGNTLTDGTGSLLGTVVYVGAATSFTDDVAGAVSGSDFYKVYAVDKAFNYSSEGGTLKANQWSLNNSISVYPNPIKDNQFSIALPETISGKVAVSIYNTLGQLVYNVNTIADSNTIAVRPSQSLKAGIYVITVENNGKTCTQKVTVSE